MKFLSEIKYVLERRALFSPAQRDEAVRYALHHTSFPDRDKSPEKEQLAGLMRLAIDLYVQDLQSRIDADLMGWRNKDKTRARWERLKEMMDEDR